MILPSLRSHSAALATGLTALVLSLTVVGCDSKKDAAPAVATPAPVAAPIKNEPTRARLVERVTERWSKIAKADWVAAYDMLGPEPKQALSLARFLGQKQVHEYKNPEIVEVLSTDDSIGYVRTAALWTPHNAEIALAMKDPESRAMIEKRFPERIEQIETWRFANGDWCWMQGERPEDFLVKHPELLKEPAKPAAATKDNPVVAK